MAKSKSKSADGHPCTKKIDPALASLFESSLGNVKPPDRTACTSNANASSKKPINFRNRGDSLVDGGNSHSDAVEYNVQSVSTERMRKRKRKAVEEDLEDSYMKKLQESDENNFKNKKAKEDLADNPSQSQSKIERDNDDGNSDSDDESAITEEFPINHETLINPAKAALDKSARTVFLGNVPSNVICSKTDYRALKKFFSAPGKISSVRFRSIAFSEQIPRKAAFVNHKLHEKQKTVNAYVVYKEVAFARAALELNGSVVLDRHIRVDSVAHPGKQDTRRCVFVGNLDFEAQEENLWRHFGACGKVEYVRVVRDSKTNVGKGFAYVQFEDAMSVDQALLLDRKKMEGDRKLRVTRTKASKPNMKTGKPTDGRRVSKDKRVYVPKVDPKQKAIEGRAAKLLGRAGATQFKKQVTVFEGLRATTGTDSGIKNCGSGKKKGGKARARATSRSTKWKSKNK